jgi:chromatin assembly factor 1 subunit B
LLASAGDDGNILLWVPADNHALHTNFEDGFEDKETWRVKHMCRSMGSEIYDLAWSPDGVFFITGSMDNVARIYNAQTGILDPGKTIFCAFAKTTTRRFGTPDC